MILFIQNSQYWWNIIFFRRSIWVLLELVRRKHKTLPKSFRRNIKPIWNPVTDVIGMECLSSRWRYPSWRKIPSSEEWEEHTVFELKDKYACFLFLSLNPLCPNSVQNQFSPNHNHRLSRAKSTRIDKMILERKIFDLLSNSLNSFFKEMFGDQFGEFVSGYQGLKG